MSDGPWQPEIQPSLGVPVLNGDEKGTYLARCREPEEWATAGDQGQDWSQPDLPCDLGGGRH
jgi:hypothetical protein